MHRLMDIKQDLKRWSASFVHRPARWQSTLTVQAPTLQSLGQLQAIPVRASWVSAVPQCTASANNHPACGQNMW